MKNHNKKLIYTLPQALFSPKNVQKIMKNMRFFKQTWKIILKKSYILCRRRFFPHEKLKNHETYEISLKNKKSCLKAHLYSAAGAFSPTNVQQILKIWETLKNQEKTNLKGHIYSAAGAFFPMENWKNHEKYEIS